MISVSTYFADAVEADVNQPRAKVQIVLGNYASSPGYGATATASTSTANYPAAGAIDGDRTEINVGPASGADNDVGLSSWRSTGIPDNGDTVTLTVTFSQSRTINRIKLYHLSSHGLKTYTLSYWDGAAWVVFAATSDVVAAGQTSIQSTGTLDVIDFDDVSTTKIKLIVTATLVAVDYANVVEIEVYRVIDVSDRVSGVTVQRNRDYKMRNPLAASVSIKCLNEDRFFSYNYTPTAAEVADGFVNSELRTGLGVLVSFGFEYAAPGSPEFVGSFVGTIDELAVNPKTRSATITARDGMKALVNKKDSSKLKASTELGACARYVLNRANISNYEMSVDVTPLTIDWFFTSAELAITTLQELVVAAVDSLFYFDEYGIATLKYYATDVDVDHVYTTEAEFEAGTLAAIATLDGSNSIQVPVKFAPTIASGVSSGDMLDDGSTFTLDNDFSGETVGQTGATTSFDAQPGGRANSVAVRIIPAQSGTITEVNFPITARWNDTATTVYIRVSLYSDDGSGAPDAEIYNTSYSLSVSGDFVIPAIPTSWIVTGGTAYHIIYEEDSAHFVGCDFSMESAPRGDDDFSGASVQARRVDDGCVDADANWEAQNRIAGSYTVPDAATTPGLWTSPVYDSLSIAVGAAAQIVGSGVFPANTLATVYLDGGDDGSTWLVTYTQTNPNGTYPKVIANHRYWRLRVKLEKNAFSASPYLPTLAVPYFYFAATGVWISPTLDTTVAVFAYRTVLATTNPNGGTVVFYTRSSADGASWDAWVAVSGDGTINSTVRRYLQIRADITLSVGLDVSPKTTDITVTYTVGGGSDKYPATATQTFRFDSTLLDVEQKISDSVGGDTSIINDATVQAQPLIKSGADADVVWQATTGTPAVTISASNPLSVTNGQTLTYYPVIPGGIDTAHMSGASPAAAVVTFAGGGAGSWVFSRIHPTRPVLVITITGTGTITALQLAGKIFTSSENTSEQRATDAESIDKHGSRQYGVSNRWIVGNATALTIASKLIENYAEETSFIPSALVRPSFQTQLGDRDTVVDDNTAMDGDYAAAGIAHDFAVDGGQAIAHTKLTLLKIPAGS